MGIRVHKVIGYGVSDFKPPEDFSSREDTVGDFLSFCRLQKDLFEKECPITSSMSLSLNFSRKSRIKEYSFHNIAIHNDEFGIPGVLVIIPVNHFKQNHSESWYRYDDIIDYVEETQLFDQQKRLVELDRGIYPYDKGQVPLIVRAACRFIGQEDLYTRLREMLYVYWS